MDKKNVSNNSDKNITIQQLFDILDKTSVGIHIWDEYQNCIFCNGHLLDLFRLDSCEDFSQNLSALVPVIQPDGTPSDHLILKHINTTLEFGSATFPWMHLTLDKEELPCQVTLHKVNNLLLGLIEDLRSHLAYYSDTTQTTDLFYNQISDKTLFNTVAELTEEWFWFYSNTTNQIQFFGKGISILNLSSEKQPFPSYIIDSGLVHLDDLENFLSFNRAMLDGIVAPFDIRFCLPDQTYRYYRIVYKTIFDENDSPLFSIGKTFDIHTQKRLEIMSMTDLLTNCLNKISTENVIEETLSEYSEESHALLIIDIDNFKAVNDNLGHHFGDLVLKEIADKLHNNFREQDIIGRIGGDEFIVFLKNLSNKNIIENKAKAVAKVFQNTYAGESETYKISASIGISLYPLDGKKYEELYQSADKALYHSKKTGKNCYTFYDSNLIDGSLKDLTILENANRLAHSYFDSDMVTAIFDILYESDNIAVALNNALRFIGNRLGVDRCYIFSGNKSGETYSITYEWCNEGICPQISYFQDAPLYRFVSFFEELDINNVLYTNDRIQIEESENYKIFRNQDIQSFLLVQARRNDSTRILLGLEDCTRPRVWSEKEINGIRYVLRLISLFKLSINN